MTKKMNQDKKAGLNGQLAFSATPQNQVATDTLGEFYLVGEIVDSKCYPTIGPNNRITPGKRQVHRHAQSTGAMLEGLRHSPPERQKHVVISSNKPKTNNDLPHSTPADPTTVQGKPENNRSRYPQGSHFLEYVQKWLKPVTN